MKSIVEYVLTRAEQEFGFPISLEFIQRKCQRAAYTEARAWVSVALKISGEEMFTAADFRRILNFGHHKSVSESWYKGRRKWSKLYWSGYAVRWDADRGMVLGRIAA
jgi:hypothetical protein